MRAPTKTETTPYFFIPTRIYLMEEIISDIGRIIKNFGNRVMIVTTVADFQAFQDAIEQIAGNLRNYNIECIVYDELPRYPNTENLDRATYFIKKTHSDLIIGFGGLESINCAKALSVLINNYIFADEIFQAENIKPPTAFITIPAYPVFGFELSPLFYLTDIHDNVKKIFYNELLYPSATIIDPRISTGIDDELTARTAVSALAISTESVISKKNNGFNNTLSLRSIDLIFKNLPTAFRDPQNLAARVQLSTASVMSGLAFASAQLSVSLAIALALSSRVRIDVETAIGVILPHVMEYNLTTSPGKYVQMSKVMDEDVKDITVIEAAIKAVEGVRKLEIDVDIPQRLTLFDVTKSDFTKVADIAIGYPFIDNAPRPLSKNEIETILIAAY